MSTRVYVPVDAAALSVGAERVARAVERLIDERGADVTLVRNGSRGLFWLEPLVEVETDAGRVAFGPVAPADVATLFDSRFKPNTKHKLHLGLTEEIPYLKKQERLTFARCGITDPLSLEDYKAHGGYRGLARALTMDGAAIVDEVTQSGLRGRGGAGFPTGIKWKTVLKTAGPTRNTSSAMPTRATAAPIADRMIMEGDPFVLIEGMTIAGIAVGATEGYVYIRSEYPHAFRADDAGRSRSRAPPAISAPASSAAASLSTSRCGSAPAPISAARRRRCSRASKASAA